MEQATATVDVDAYASELGKFIRTRSESSLYRASLLSRGFVEQRVGPEEIVALHVEALQQVTRSNSHREQAIAATDGLHFLLEVMIAYGVQHKEYLELRLKELAKSEADKGEVLAVIAHELRTPITAVRGSLDLAERSLQRGDVERISPLLGRSREAVDRLARLTRDLFDASRANAPQLQRRAVDVDAVLSRAVSWAKTAAGEKELKLTHETAGAPAPVLADEDALLSVFGNLLANAIRYTPEGGRILVRHGSDGRYVWTEVRDTGIGMAPDVQARIFEKFYRAPDAHLSSVQGLGLGLTIVKQLVEAHGGQIGVDSAPGEGSTFRVTLACLDDGTTRAPPRGE